MDSSNLLLSNLENIDLPEFNRGTHRFIMFKKVSGSLEMKNDTTTTVDSGRLITSIASYQGRDYRHIPLGNFVQSVVSGKTKCEKLPALPAIKSRTKKNEEQERKKRQRAQERKVREAQQRAADAGGTGGGGAFTSTTLDEKSREARRAERERLREEHMRTLTPEEIAEKERARRQRMEEEAAQWNIMSEDEGDTYDEVVEEDTELDDDSDDDVLDLD